MTKSTLPRAIAIDLAATLPPHHVQYPAKLTGI